MKVANVVARIRVVGYSVNNTSSSIIHETCSSVGPVTICCLDFKKRTNVVAIINNKCNLYVLI